MGGKGGGGGFDPGMFFGGGMPGGVQTLPQCKTSHTSLSIFLLSSTHTVPYVESRSPLTCHDILGTLIMLPYPLCLPCLHACSIPLCLLPLMLILHESEVSLHQLHFKTW